MIILLNGPPGCGKDTIAKIIKKKIGSKDYKMSRPIKQAFGALFGLQGELLHEMIEGEFKDVAQWKDSQYTPRDVLINLSEDFMKPRFGKDIFGQSAVNFLQRLSFTHLTISDTGFNAEVPPICQWYGYHKVKAILIDRKGCKWDSRERIDVTALGIDGYILNNAHDLDMLDAQVHRVLRKWELVDDGS